MNHENYKEILQLYLYDELSENEKLQLEAHLKTCSECREELEQQKVFLSRIKDISVPLPDQQLLNEARRELRAALKVEKSRNTLGENLSAFFRSLFDAPYKLALSSAAFMIIGFLLGVLFFSRTETLIIQPDEDQNITALDENIRVSNFRFIDKDATDGEIEFTFEAVKPVTMKGSLDDERIQKVLLYSMLNEENPGTRLNAVNAISEKGKVNFDTEIKASILMVAKYDQNPGVRGEALKMLRSFSFDNEVKETLLYVLMNDSSSALRIEAINNLKNAAGQGFVLGPEEISVLRERMEEDENNYVRFTAKTVLKEYK